MDSTRKLFSANPRQLCSSSSGVDNFPWWETPVRYTWKDHWMPSANGHFWLLFRVEFIVGQRLFSHTDNLSRTLQQTKMSALSGKRVACLTKDVLQNMRNDTSFRSFYDVVLLKSKSYPSMSGPNPCYQGELTRQEELKLSLESQHILWPHKHAPPPPQPPTSPPQKNFPSRTLL